MPDPLDNYTAEQIEPMRTRQYWRAVRAARAAATRAAGPHLRDEARAENEHYEHIDAKYRAALAREDAAR